MPFFKVRAWTKREPLTEVGEEDDEYPIGPKDRWPSQLFQIRAADGKAAAFEVARILGIPKSDWWDVGPEPRVVIRVSNPEDQDP